MANMIAFLNSFLSYLLLFVIIVAVVIIACIIGVKLRKNKNEKDALLAEQETALKQKAQEMEQPAGQKA